MTKILFCFAGTGDTADSYSDLLENNCTFNQDVIRVYLHGCDHEKVGDGFLFPDLEIVSQAIRNAFSADQTLDLEKLFMQLGTGLGDIYGPLIGRPKIDSIGLHGFSRGAVTTFAVAKKLNDLNIPIDIIANQPVPGQSTENAPGSLFTKYNDLRQCKNIRSAATFIGTYNLENGFLHNSFFQQMLAQFPDSIEVNTWLIPHQNHLDWFSHSLLSVHLIMHLEQVGYSSLTTREKDILKKSLLAEYNKAGICFTPSEFSQKIYGEHFSAIVKHPIYLESVNREAKLALGRESELNQEQASAIVTLSKINSLNSKKQQQLMDFVAQDSDKGMRLAQIINKVHEITQYLTYVTRDGKSNKSLLIDSYSEQYKQELFCKSHDYLSLENPNKQDRERLIEALKRANKEFDYNALGLDRGIARKSMMIAFNFILALTVIGLVANAINFYITKGESWFFFDKTRSEKVVDATSTEIETIAMDTSVDEESSLSL